MAQDLTIRLLGRPKLSQDSQAGFHTLVRRYVAQGPRASKGGIEDANNPLFLPVGTTDEEFSDYKLVNQSIEPAQGSMDRAYVNRSYVDLRERWVSESVTQTPDLFKLNRKFVVLRGQDDVHGYSAAAWAKHPSNAAVKNPSEDAWDYAPVPVTNGQPRTRNMSFNSASDDGLTYTPNVSIAGTSQTFATYMQGVSVAETGLGSWLRGKASVQMAAPGIDVWDVEWVTHGEPYWTFGTTSQRGGGKSQAMTIVDFDYLGLKLSTVGSSGSSSSSAVQAKTYNFFVVADELPDSVAQVAGGSGTAGGGSSPSVNLDFHIQGYEGRGWTFKQFIKNAVWTINTDANLEFPTYGGGLKTVGEKKPYQLKFDSGPFEAGVGYVGGGKFANVDGANLPMFQNAIISNIGGQITWTGTQLTVYTSGSSSTIVSNIVSTKISPIFNYGNQKIWKVQITYVG
jgi:hypothetical protein